jgi:hypothetical protein
MAAVGLALVGLEMATFIQWKGTDLCMDFWCPSCGEHSHFDGLFAYVIQCPHCDAYFKMPQDVPVEELPGGPGDASVLRGCI